MEGGGTLVVGVSGVRGVVGEALTPEVAARFAAAFGTWCRGGTVVVGRDSRPSGPALEHAVLSGLLATGCRVIDVGLCPTPTLQLAVRHHRAAGAVIVTASHNPAEYNGLKFVSDKGIFLTAEEGAGLRDLLRRGEFSYIGNRPGPKMEVDTGACRRHVERVLALPLVHADRIRARRFHVVLDPGNGVGGLVAGPLLAALGCRVEAMNAEPTGEFGRPPEPVPEHLTDLAARVRASGADAGFALDPDGDRLSIVDEKGRAIGEEYSMVLAADLVLSRMGGGPVVTNLSTSGMIDAVASRRGGVVHRTPVGEVHVSLRMMSEGAVVGGEGNGGVILPAAHFGRDASVGIALVLELLAERGSTISGACGDLPRLTMIKKKIPVDPGLAGRLPEVLRPLFEGAEVDRTDGIKIRWPDGWLHVRASNTEPVVRVVAEAEDPGRAGARIADALRLLHRT